MTRKWGLDFPDEPKKKAARLRWAELCMPFIYGVPASEVYEGYAEIYGETPKDLTSLVDMYYPNREIPEPRKTKFSVPPSLPEAKIFAAYENRYPGAMEILNQAAFQINPNPYFLAAFNQPDESLSGGELAYRLREQFGLRMTALQLVHAGYSHPGPDIRNPVLKHVLSPGGVSKFRL